MGRGHPFHLDRELTARVTRRLAASTDVIIDVWMQGPTLRFLGHDMFESLGQWTGQQVPEEQPPIDATVAAMDHAGIRHRDTDGEASSGRSKPESALHSQ